MTDPAKVRRHAERCRELVASVVRSQIKDPRLGMITITDARITADLREATVFYTVLGDAPAQASTAAALESAKGDAAQHRREGAGAAPLADPDLRPRRRAGPGQADRRPARPAAHADAEVQRLAARAKYAGDAQPYRVDDEVDDVDDEAADTDTDTSSTDRR